MATKQKFIGMLKKELFSIRTSALFYVAWAFYAVATAARFFFGSQFFSGNATSDLRFFFSAIPSLCVLAIPLLAITARLKPFDEGAPLHALFLFLAKQTALAIAFFAMNFLLLLIPLCVSFFGDIDFGQLFLGFFGIFLYGIFALCVSLFVNVLCPNSALAFFVSAIVLAAFNGAHLLAVYTGITGRLLDAIQMVSFAWHFDAAGKGIADTRDIAFFVIWTLFFLAATAFVFTLKRGGKSYTRLFVFFTLNCILLTVISSKLFLRVDFSREKQFSVSVYSERALNKADAILRITYFLSPELKRLYPQVRDVQDFLLQYAQKNARIKLSIINPNSEKGEAQIAGYGLQPQQLRAAGKNKTEYISVYSAIVLEYLDKSHVIPFELSAATLEYDLTSAVETIVSGIERRALIISGNGLDIDSDYSYVRPWLESAGVKTHAILGADLSETDLDPAIPIVVFGSSAFSQAGAEAISHFLDAGGRAFFAVSALDVDISSDWTVSERKEDFILPLLESKGISIKNEIVADISSSQIILDSADENATQTRQDIFNYPLWISILPQRKAKEGVTVFWGNPVEIEDGTPLLATTNAAWLMKKQNEGEYIIDTNPFRVPKTADGNSAQYFLGAEKGGIIALGDQYFAASLMLSYINTGAVPDFRNLDFLLSSVLHLQNADDLAALKHSATSTYALYKITDTAEFVSAMRLTLFLTLVFPVIFVVAAAFFSAFLRRRRI